MLFYLHGFAFIYRSRRRARFHAGGRRKGACAHHENDGVWLGIFELAERSRLTEKFARALRPLNRVLFGELPGKSNEYVSMNISANMLGMSGATTPMGIKSIQELEKHPDTSYQIAMFFVINATSIQILPTSVLALRTSLGSLSPSDIILPTILATTLSSVVGILLVKIFLRKKKK